MKPCPACKHPHEDGLSEDMPPTAGGLCNACQSKIRQRSSQFITADYNKNLRRWAKDLPYDVIDNGGPSIPFIAGERLNKGDYKFLQNIADTFFDLYDTDPSWHENGVIQLRKIPISCPVKRRGVTDQEVVDWVISNVKVAVRLGEVPKRCQATLDKGDRCGNRATDIREGHDVCFRHRIAKYFSTGPWVTAETPAPAGKQLLALNPGTPVTELLAVCQAIAAENTQLRKEINHAH